MNNDQYGKIISVILNSKGISQKKFSNILGISPSTLSKWINGKTCININDIPKICEVLEISYDDFFHPQETLQRIAIEIESDNKSNLTDKQVETTPNLPSSSPIPPHSKQVKMFKSIKHKIIIIVLLLILCLSVCLSFKLYSEHNFYQYRIVTTKYDKSDIWGRSFDIALSINAEITASIVAQLTSKIEQEWQSGKYPDDIDIINIYFYSNQEDASSWIDTPFSSHLLNCNKNKISESINSD